MGGKKKEQKTLMIGKRWNERFGALRGKGNVERKKKSYSRKKIAIRGMTPYRGATTWKKGLLISHEPGGVCKQEKDF